MENMMSLLYLEKGECGCLKKTRFLYGAICVFYLQCIKQPRSQGTLSTSRKYPGYGWSRV